jgi:hypothetical protein
MKISEQILPTTTLSAISGEEARQMYFSIREYMRQKVNTEGDKILPDDPAVPQVGTAYSSTTTGAEVISIKRTPLVMPAATMEQVQGVMAGQNHLQLQEGVFLEAETEQQEPGDQGKLLLIPLKVTTVRIVQDLCLLNTF